MKLEILTQSLQHWHKESGIQHEWKTNSPYQAWVVETILQQTRIAGKRLHPPIFTTLS